MGKKYQRRVGNLIRQKITQLLLRESKDPRLSMVTITDVVVNRDTTRAEVYYSIIGTPEELAEVQVALEKAAPWLRAEMKPTLRLRHIPQLVFIYDPSLERGERIESILTQLQQEESKAGPGEGEV